VESIRKPGKCRVIAEVGVNHNGSEELAKDLVDAAVSAGADTVKFQVFSTDELVRKDSPKAPYQVLQDSGSRDQRDMLRRLELSRGAIARISQYAADRDLAFMATPFDLESLEFLLDEMHQKEIKIASADAVDHRLLVRAGQSSSYIFLSTGMCSMEEVHRALASISHGQQGRSLGDVPLAMKQIRSLPLELRDRVTILHCTSSYPAPLSEANLMALTALREAFGLPVGYSDHTEGFTASVAAVSLGASAIEKHLTLDKSDNGPDHAASLNPREFSQMVQLIRDAELALGDGEKRLMPSETENRDHLRKGLYASRDLAAGEIWRWSDFDCRRPAGSWSVGDLPEFLGKKRSLGYRRADEIDRI
jgi:sialic acid synthase SpsE